MSREQRVVAIGLLTEQDVALLGPRFDRLFPIDPTPQFDDLLRAIDEAQARLRRDPDA